MKRKDNLRKVYKDYVLYLYNLDPYFINDAFEYGESAEQFADRVSEGMTKDDVLYDINYMKDGYFDSEDDMEIMDKLKEFEQRAMAC